MTATGTPEEGLPADEPGSLPVRTREVRYRGAKWDVVTDEVVLGPETVVRRDVVVHPGAVGVVALDDRDRVLLVQQYRHPVRGRLWEVPAGLLDIPGEDPLECARRELFEEAHLRADRYDLLVDLLSSPGMTSEAYRVYLARDLSEVAVHERHEQQDEERDMPARWYDLDAACEAVVAGRVRNAMAAVALLATQAARRAGWATLRPADTAWPGRPADSWPGRTGDADHR